MNKVILMGRLTREPEIRYSKNANSKGESNAIASYTLAVDRRFKREGEPDADFFNCAAFGKNAKFAENYLHQGTKLLVVGHIQNDNYTNKEGQKTYSVKIIVDEQEFGESKNANSASQQSAPINQQQNLGDGFMNIPDGIDDELPFS